MQVGRSKGMRWQQVCVPKLWINLTLVWCIMLQNKSLQKKKIFGRQLDIYGCWRFSLLAFCRPVPIFRWGVQVCDWLVANLREALVRRQCPLFRSTAASQSANNQQHFPKMRLASQQVNSFLAEVQRRVRDYCQNTMLKWFSYTTWDL